MNMFFSEPSGPICGNKIVEAGEECDCGYDDECDSDNCCTKRTVSGSDNCKYNAKAKAVSSLNRCR